MRNAILLAALLALAFTLAACGGGSGQGATPGTPQAAAAAGDATRGQALFNKSLLNGNAGCTTCHSLAPGKALLGPSLAGLARRAGDMVPGQSAEQYLHTAIVDSNAFLARGCNASNPEAQCVANIMPQDWSRKLSEQEINDLVAWLLTLK